jgi:hypothetical protein
MTQIEDRLRQELQESRNGSSPPACAPGPSVPPAW